MPIKVSEAQPVRLQAEEMRIELDLALSKNTQWKRFCEHTSTIGESVPYVQSASKTIQNQVLHQSIWEDLIIYLRGWYAICILMKRFNQYLKVLQWLPISHKLETVPPDSGVSDLRGQPWAPKWLQGGALVSDESLGLPIHSMELDSFRQQLLFLMNVYGIPVTSLDNSEPQSAANTLKKEATWCEFINLVPEKELQQEKMWSSLHHKKYVDELWKSHLVSSIGKIRKKKLQIKTDREHRRLVHAMNAFLRALRKHNTDRNDTISRSELLGALQDENLFPPSKRMILFGDVDSEIILEYLDKDHNGQISYNELLSFMEETGINMQNRFLGYQRRVIRNLPTFLETLQATLLTNVKRVYVEEKDLKRTVGINTGHIGTTDFNLEPEDVTFVLERGRRSLEAFLKYYVATNHLKKKPEYKSMNDLRKNSKGSLISSNSCQSLGSTDAVNMEVTSPAVPSIPPIDQPSASEDSKISEAPVKSKSTVKFQALTENIQWLNDQMSDSPEVAEADVSETVNLLGDKSSTSQTRERVYIKHTEPAKSTSPTSRQIEKSLFKLQEQTESNKVTAQIH
ncbi:hypothetical protein Btru_026284 [Bulinus truncatus]|nr:hypothetical protein Btru_026284 [Bulinus truncatus]